jgi:8-oxo-dGTP diphosphatase
MEPITLAGCIIIDEYDRLLLLHRGVGERTQWELPGGKVEEDEALEHAAIRELHESLGVNVRLIRQAGMATFEQAGQLYQYHWFEAKIVFGEPTVMELNRHDDFDYFDIEDMASLSLSLNMYELLDRILSGEVVLAA